MEFVWLLLFIAVSFVGWLMNLFALPGNWVVVGAAVIYALLVPPESRFQIGWIAVGALVALALLGELLELVAGAYGAKRVGGSRRGAVLAMIGAMIGSFVGAAVGLPIPVVGSLIGVILFACVGALCGAMLGERWKGRSVEESWQIGQAAFWGRLMGTFAKTLIATTMVAVALAVVLWPRARPAGDQIPRKINAGANATGWAPVPTTVPS